MQKGTAKRRGGTSEAEDSWLKQSQDELGGEMKDHRTSHRYENGTAESKAIDLIGAGGKVERGQKDAVDGGTSGGDIQK